MKKLLIAAIALATVAAVTKAKSEKKITKGTLSAESVGLINNDSEKKTLREWRKDPRYKKPELNPTDIKINLDPLIRAEKKLEYLRSLNL